MPYDCLADSERAAYAAVGRDGRLLLVHYNADAGDNPALGTVPEAVRSGRQLGKTGAIERIDPRQAGDRVEVRVGADDRRQAPAEGRRGVQGVASWQAGVAVDQGERGIEIRHRQLVDGQAQRRHVTGTVGRLLVAPSPPVVYDLLERLNPGLASQAPRGDCLHHSSARLAIPAIGADRIEEDVAVDVDPGQRALRS